MLLSIIIPVYNSAPFLSECIRRLSLRLGIATEILLVDDGSTDGSSELCDQLRAMYPQIRSFHQPNRGVSSARNRGLAEARGEYVLFLDADDQLDYPKLLEILSELERQPELEFGIFGIVFEYYRNGVCYRTDSLCYPQRKVIEREQFFQEMSRLYACNYLSSACNKLFRRSFLTENAMTFDPEMFLLEDLHFSLRCLSRCNSILCYDQAIYHYRQTEDEGNAGRRLKRISRISALIDRLQDAFYELADSLGQERSVFDDQLADIFLMLARQKIQVSDRNTIKEVCGNLKAWLPAHRVSPEKLSGKYTRKILQQKADWLYWRSRYSALRHRIANFVKYLRFRIRKGGSHGETAPPAV